MGGGGEACKGASVCLVSFFTPSIFFSFFSGKEVFCEFEQNSLISLNPNT